MGFFSFLRALRENSSAAVSAHLDEVEARVHALSAPAARAAAEAALAAGRTFRVDRRAPSPDERAALAAAPGDVRALLEPYAVVDLGGARLERAAIGPWRRDPTAYVRVGSDVEHADVVARREDGVVFVVEDDGAPTPTFNERHPSVWHYLLVVEALARPDAAQAV